MIVDGDLKISKTKARLEFYNRYHKNERDIIPHKLKSKILIILLKSVCR